MSHRPVEEKRRLLHLIIDNSPAMNTLGLCTTYTLCRLTRHGQHVGNINGEAWPQSPNLPCATATATARFLLAE